MTSANRSLFHKILEQPECGSALFVTEPETGQPAGFIHLKNGFCPELIKYAKEIKPES